MSAVSHGGLRVLTRGFWFPVGRSNFYNAEEDGYLIEPFNAYKEPRSGKLSGYRWDELNSDMPTLPSRIQTSVYSRLVTVLSSGFRPARADASLNALNLLKSKRYSRIYPMFKATLHRLGADSDPDAAVFVCTKDDLALIPEWRKLSGIMQGLALVLVADGFYVWLALYQGSTVDSEDRARQTDVDEALRVHIIRLLGGDYSNRSASKAETIEQAGIPRTETLETYRDDNLGMLSFFQINLVFEGLFNYSLDPRIFFDDGSNGNPAPSSLAASSVATKKTVDDVKKTYSLERFFTNITAITEVAPEDPQRLEKVIRDLLQLFSLPDDLPAEDYLRTFKELRDDCVNVKVRRDLLRQFLRRTSIDTLHLLKLRIESCNRLLLGGMIKIAHLREPFVQLDVPPSANKAMSRQDRFHIQSANDGQLRGYTILMAAKLPLIETVWTYLDSNLVKLGDDTEFEGGSATRSTISGLERSWKALLTSIKEDITGLQLAIDLAYKDQMLSETEKLRAEEETLAEIERIRERSGSEFSPATNLSVNIIANVIALGGVVAAVILAGPQLQGLLPYLLNLQREGPVAVLGTVVIVLCVAIVAVVILYFVLHELADPLIRRYSRWRQRRRRGDEQYYYEMDLRLDASTDFERVKQLLASDFAPQLQVHWWLDLSRHTRRMKPRVDRWRLGPWDHRPQRNSYRVNRSSADEALHKVYVVASVLWPRRLLPTPWFAQRRLRIFLVYEVFFHKPSAAESFEFKALRIVSTSIRLLTPSQLEDLQSLIVAEFINRWITKTSEQLGANDALLSLGAKFPRTRRE